MKHKLPSPFPYKQYRNTKEVVVVLDEKCVCGCRRSEHEDTTFEYGHGGIPGLCEQFTWVDFILLETK